MSIILSFFQKNFNMRDCAATGAFGRLYSIPKSVPSVFFGEGFENAAAPSERSRQRPCFFGRGQFVAGRSYFVANGCRTDVILILYARRYNIRAGRCAQSAISARRQAEPAWLFFSAPRRGAGRVRSVFPCAKKFKKILKNG